MSAGGICMCSRYTVCAASVQRMFLSFDKRAQINLRRLNLPVQLKSPARPPNLQSALGNQPCIRSFSKKKGKSAKMSLDDSVIDMHELSSNMEKVLDALKWEYTNSIVSRVTPVLFEQLRVEEGGGQKVPLRNIAQVSMPSPQAIVINMTSDPKAVDGVVRAIQDMGRGFNPLKEGNILKVPLPKMSKDARTALVKVAKEAAEKAKVGIRRCRQKGISDARKRKDEVSEDDIKKTEKQVQVLTDEFVKKTEELLDSKTKEVMGS